MAESLTLGTSAIRELDGLFSLNDIHVAAGGVAHHQPAKFMCLEQTKALIAELGNSPNSESLETAGISAVKTVTGRNGGTYACRELVIAYAAWISAAFHLKVIRVFLGQHPARQADAANPAPLHDCTPGGKPCINANPSAPALPGPKAQALQASTTLLQFMLITTDQGGSAVQVRPAGDLPKLLLQKDSPFSNAEVLQIAEHANTRMFIDVANLQSASELEQLRKTVRTLCVSDLTEIAKQAWLELSLRTGKALGGGV